LILKQLPELPPHFTSPELRAEASTREAENKLFDAGSTLASRLDSRAAAFFDPSIDPTARSHAVALADAAVDTARTGLEQLLRPSHSPAKAGTWASEPAQWWDGYAKGELLDLERALPSALASSRGLDFIIGGSIEDRSGYAEVTIYAYDSSVARRVFTLTGYCAPADPAPLARAFAEKIESWIAARPFARITVRPSPDSASIAADDAMLNPGSRLIYRFEAGDLRLRVDAPGFLPVETTLHCELGRNSEVAVRLSPAATGTVTIETDPPAAELSLDSIPKGKAPLQVDLNGTRIIVSASAPGHESALAVLPEKGNANVAIDLLPSDGLGPGGRVDRAKDSFYRSLGWLVLSIPVTALTAGIANGYTEAAVRSGDMALLGTAQKADVALGTAAVATAVLAINAVVHLVQYLGTAH
ncbi:MAG TPA: hypothetical protein VMC79_00825, partial [Rectinemataceae bacterium]|nr:hypothetical protein [Rectinemataceae bacterium]